MGRLEEQSQDRDERDSAHESEVARLRHVMAYVDFVDAQQWGEGILRHSPLARRCSLSAQ
jgi:hypothetical protein